MRKIRNFYRELYHRLISRKINSTLLKVLVLPIFTTTLYLTVSYATQAGEVGKQKSEEAGQISYGNRISLNGRTLPGAWLQRQTISGLITQISDTTLRQFIGVDLLNSSNPYRQPIQWFSSVTNPEVLPSVLLGGYRYLDITDFAQKAGWQIQTHGNTLMISTAIANLRDIDQNQQAFDNHITIDLDRPTPWQVKQESSAGTSWMVSVDGILQETEAGRTFPPGALIQELEVVNNQTLIHLNVPYGLSPRVTTLANPNRLRIDFLPDAIAPRDIVWAPGLRWRQQSVNLGQERFPVVWLEVNPRTSGIKLKPIWANPNTLVGTAPLIQTAQKYSAVAAINSGYFNRHNQLPLGAIRRDGQWLSSPILNRGAIAWNDAGQFYMGRLTLQETLISGRDSLRVQLPISFLNSGYVQNSIARYTPAWGPTYTPLSDNEIILVIENNKVTHQFPGGKAGLTSISIPQNGYLLILRGDAVNQASNLPIGTAVNIISSTSPADFNNYSNIIGAGPLLVQNRQIVLNAKAEQFSNAFIAQKAIRSGICTTATGSLIIAAIHNRAGGAGPSLAEHARLMQLLGCVNALNLDGGSSTSLYLGGQLLDRSSSTAARVHNGIGIFLPLRQVNGQH